MKHILTTSALALVGAALFTTSAQAQSTTAYVDGDIMLGFRQVGTANDYLVDLGQPGQFFNATAPFTLSLGNIKTDLIAVFGSNWYTVTETANTHSVKYAITGGNVGGSTDVPSDIADTIYTTKLTATPWNHSFDSTQSGWSTATDSVGSAYDSNQSTANSPVGYIQAAASANSYASWQPGGSNSSGISYGAFNPSNEGTVSQSLYFDRLVPSNNAPGDVLGTFSIDSNANVTFTPAAVPEPSTFAMLGLGASFVGLIRRRRTAQA